MLGFFQELFIRLLSICTVRMFNRSLASNFEGRIKYVSLNNWTCEARPTLVNIKTYKTLYYRFTISVNKCGGNFKTIDDPYAWVFVPNKVNNMNL